MGVRLNAFEDAINRIPPYTVSKNADLRKPLGGVRGGVGDREPTLAVTKTLPSELLTAAPRSSWHFGGHDGQNAECCGSFLTPASRLHATMSSFAPNAVFPVGSAVTESPPSGPVVIAGIEPVLVSGTLYNGITAAKSQVCPSHPRP